MRRDGSQSATGIPQHMFVQLESGSRSDLYSPNPDSRWLVLSKPKRVRSLNGLLRFAPRVPNENTRLTSMRKSHAAVRCAFRLTGPEKPFSGRCALFHFTN